MTPSNNPAPHTRTAVNLSDKPTHDWLVILARNKGYAPQDQVVTLNNNPPTGATLYGTIPLPTTFPFQNLVHIALPRNLDNLTTHTDVIKMLRPYMEGQ